MAEQETWFDFVGTLKAFIKYVLGFFAERSRQKKEQKREKTIKRIQNKYDEIDKHKNKRKKKKIEDRLDNLF